jgi:hypothetical protein
VYGGAGDCRAVDPKERGQGHWCQGAEPSDSAASSLRWAESNSWAWGLIWTAAQSLHRAACWPSLPEGASEHESLALHFWTSSMLPLLLRLPVPQLPRPTQFLTATGSQGGEKGLRALAGLLCRLLASRLTHGWQPATAGSGPQVPAHGRGREAS